MLGLVPMLAGFVLIASSFPAYGEGSSSVSTEADLSARYLFYLHGAIVEGKGSGVVHPKFGAYEYDEIVDRFGDAGWSVISEVRPSGTRVDAYAKTVEHRIETLLEQGVSIGDIAVMGHSKGGAIALEVASLMQRDDLRFVILAACFPQTSWQNLSPKGRFLSVFDSSDEVAGSCFEIGAEPRQVHEIRMDLGEGHGLFYRARASWVDPVLDWLR